MSGNGESAASSTARVNDDFDDVAALEKRIDETQEQLKSNAIRARADAFSAHGCWLVGGAEHELDGQQLRKTLSDLKKQRLLVVELANKAKVNKSVFFILFFFFFCSCLTWTRLSRSCRWSSRARTATAIGASATNRRIGEDGP